MFQAACCTSLHGLNGRKNYTEACSLQARERVSPEHVSCKSTYGRSRCPHGPTATLNIPMYWKKLSMENSEENKRNADGVSYCQSPTVCLPCLCAMVAANSPWQHNNVQRCFILLLKPNGISSSVQATWDGAKHSCYQQTTVSNFLAYKGSITGDQWRQ